MYVKKSKQEAMLNSQQENYQNFCDAFVKKNRLKIKDLINDNVPVNCSNSRGNTPLHWTICQFNDTDIMILLLNKGADIFARNENNETPLNLAVQLGKMEAASLLLEKGALDNDDLNTLLLAAVDGNHRDIVTLLIDYAKKRNPSIDLIVPFQTAISQKNAEIMKLIIPHCSSLTSSNRYIPKDLVMKSGLKAKKCLDLLLNDNNFIIHPDHYHDEDFIYKAVENGHLLIVLQLLKHGIDVNMINSKTRFNLLTIACLKKRYNVIEKLLEHNADVNMSIPDEELKNVMTFSINLNLYRQLLKSYDKESDSIDVTCLHVAVFNSDPKMIKLLLKYGAKIKYDPTFSIIIRVAVYNNCEKVVQLFLEHGISPDNPDPKGNSLIHFCIYYNSSRNDYFYNIVKLLIESGANIQAPGNDLIFGAIINGHLKIVQLLLDENVDVQYVDPNGETLLHTAVKKIYDIKMIECLLKLNVSVNAANNEGFTPLSLLCKSIFSINLVKMIELLLKYGAEVNLVNNRLMTPLHFACYSEHTKLAQINRDESDYSFLMNVANMYSHGNDWKIINRIYSLMVNVVELLLKHGANVEAVDDRGLTPYIIASHSDNNEVVECLLKHHLNSHAVINNGDLPIYIECQFEGLCIDICPSTDVSQYMKLFIQLIKNFTSTYVSINSSNTNRYTLLHYAVLDLNNGMIKKLIKYGADVNVLYGIDSLTPLQTIFHTMKEYSRSEIDTLVTHIIKLKAAGLHVNNKDWNIINHHFHSQKVKVMEKCQKEIQLMKCTTSHSEDIGKNRYITFYNLLKKSIYYLSRYVHIEDIEEYLKADYHEFEFPLYINIIRNRFREAKVRRTLMNSAREYFKLRINQQLPDECIDAIWSNLNNEDLKTFLDATRSPNDRQSSLLTRIIRNTRESINFHY
ncbi:putative ankyrin repeat protein RF_0381 [Chelonus insularis]|uniref:putative ankyrin repeat protein RF_0381 n=1 Tax=Chelonus insularis TaxID=460826 RepID=UPI00158E1559|nr:putative ankyrin repeat protein RF_0381 [Chelonus insularis]